jgi:hypothetical protein
MEELSPQKRTAGVNSLAKTNALHDFHQNRCKSGGLSLALKITE